MSVSRLLPAELIRQVADATDIVEFIGNDLPLRKTGSTYTTLCFCHAEKTPSFNVNPARQSFKCFGCGVHGSVIDYVMLREEATFPVAVRRLAERAGITIPEETGDGKATKAAVPAKQAPRALGPRPTVRRSLCLPHDLHQGTPRELQTVADLRGVSLAGAALARERGVLSFGSPRGCPSWLVADAERVNAQARRMDGTVWEHIGGKKAYTLPGSRAAWPIGTREASSFPYVVMVEGGPDLLAAHHFIVAEERESDVAAVAMLGAANRIPADALKLLAGKCVRLFPHTDPAGRAAAVSWAGQLESVGCEVDAFRFDGLRRSDGGMVNDLNDLANLDADCFEMEQADLSEVLPR